MLIAILFGDMLFRSAVLKPDEVCHVFQLGEFVIFQKFPDSRVICFICEYFHLVFFIQFVCFFFVRFGRTKVLKFDKVKLIKF